MKKIYILIILISSNFGVYSQEENTEEYFEISKNLTIFSEVYKNINFYFVDETNPGELMKTGIDAMLKSLDPYTNFIPESNIEDYRMMQSGQYGGIGSLIRKQGEYVQITNPYKDFPAQKAGLKAGDIIKEIDGKSIKGKSSTEVSNLLKGAKGTDVILSIERPKELKLLPIKVTRELIKIPTVPYFKKVSSGIGYIKLTQFMGTSSSELGNAFRSLLDSNNITSLILDLRGNPGGLLNESVNIVNMFVPKGTKVVETKGRLKQNNLTYFGRNKPVDLKIPIVVLINERSASASEIVSGTLQDLDRAVIIGNQSYGKGLVQQTKSMDYNSMIKLTIAKYYTPSGRCIQRLDYSNRNTTGKGTNISDSLVQSFTTKNGRPVSDGRGITPDIEISEKSISSISAALLTKDIIFDFATDFYYENKSIASPIDYKLGEDVYKKFVLYALKKDFEYSTGSEKILERLKEVAKNEQYFESAKEEFDALVKSLSPNKERDLDKFKDEIIMLIENEIVGRYYFQEGQMTHDLAKDDYVLKAIEVLSNKAEYNKILKP
ncbi:S41 family peptidase [Flavobacteriales bacterium]|nr:S41 family peptidase [Flavobacteriales bacterium]